MNESFKSDARQWNIYIRLAPGKSNTANVNTLINSDVTTGHLLTIAIRLSSACTHLALRLSHLPLRHLPVYFSYAHYDCTRGSGATSGSSS
jgi:hypothetical protein